MDRPVTRSPALDGPTDCDRGVAEQAVGLVVAGHAPRLFVPGERAPELHPQIGQNAARGGDMTLLDIGHRWRWRST